MSFVGVPCIIIGDCGRDVGVHSIPIGTIATPIRFIKYNRVYRIVANSEKKFAMPMGGWYVPEEDLQPVDGKIDIEELV